MIQDSDSVVHHAVRRHHVGVGGGDVGHGGWKGEVGWIGGAHPNLKSTGPLRHCPLQLHREDFARTQGPVGENDAVIEIIFWAVKDQEADN